MAGNRAVAGLMARRAATPGPAQVVQRQPKGKLVDASLDEIQVNPPEPPKPYALQYQSDSLDEAASSLAKDVKHPGDVLIIGLQSKLLIVYGKDGKRISPRFDVKLPPGVRPSPGVYLSPSAKDADENKRSFPMRQINVDPTTEDWKLGGYVAFLKQEEDRKKQAQAAGGTAPPAEDQGSTGQGPDAATTPGAGDPTKGRKPLPMLNLRSYVQNGQQLDAIIAQHNDALQFYLVPEPAPSTGGKGTGTRTSGFAGELEGKGQPPNAPPWPVKIEGPQMVPLGGDALFSANIIWSANGSNLIDMTTSQIGTYIHYRWEMFDVTQLAEAQKQRTLAQANQLKAAIAAAGKKEAVAQAAGGGAGATGSTGTGKGAGGAGSQAKAGGGTATDGSNLLPAASGVFGSEDKIDKDQQLAVERLKRGSGADVTGSYEAAENFKRDYSHLWTDTKRAWNDVGSSGDTVFERRMNDTANITALALLPVSALVTTVGATMRLLGDAFAGERQQQGVPMKKEGTYLIRVITTPRVQVDREGKEVIRPSSVASAVFEVVPAERMLKEALDAPKTELDRLNADLQKAKDAKKPDPAQIKALEEKVKSFELKTTGDPLEMLEAQIKAKKAELDAAHAAWDHLNIKGPVVKLELELDALEKTKKVYVLQESRRKEAGGISTPYRVNAVLSSEVTGQPYPLVISVGPMATVSGRHHWKVLDATSKNAEGFDGWGATPSAALLSALNKFGGDASYGRGTIGVRLPETLPLEDGAPREFRIVSAPTGWAIARTRIDDLVAVLVALGLLVTSAGTAAAVIGALVAGARLLNRLYQGKLYLDAEMITDLLAVLGGVGAIAGHAVGASAKAAARLQLRAVGGRTFALLPEGVQEARIAEAAVAISKASSLARGVEMANEVMNYAGVVWGNISFLDQMADIAIKESNNEITHAEARRMRTNAIGGAIQNNGLFLAGNYMKAKGASKKAAPREGAPAEGGGTTGGETGTKPAETGTKPAETGTTKPQEGGLKPAEGGGTTEPQEGGTRPADDATGAPKATDEGALKPGDEAGAGARQAGPAPGEAGGPGSKPAGIGEPRATGVAPGAPGAPAKRPPRPGGVRERRAAHKALQDAARGQGDLKAAAQEAIGKGGTWKEGLKEAVSKLQGEERKAAEQALVEARDSIVKEEWDKVKASKREYANLDLENAGTKSFSSDIDATIRPLDEAKQPGADMASQIETAAKAAQDLSDALRKRVGGETDAVIDTNIYSFIGEGRVQPVEAAGKNAQQHVDLVVGMAEQLRGQGEAAFKAFEKRLAARAGDPQVAAETGRLLGEAREFHAAREAEWKGALKDAGVKPNAKPTPEQARAAREALLGQKKSDLGGLMKGEPPNHEAIAKKQAEINWFAPDAYATPSAFKQAVAHGQRLKGTGRAAAEATGKEVGAKLREQASKLPATDPRAKKLVGQAELAERQGKLLDMTLRDLAAAREQMLAEAKASEGPPASARRVQELEAQAAGFREAIATTAERLAIGEILDITTPTDQPAPERLSQSAAASGANVGMLESHVKHATDIDGKVKAAAKYAARIAMAEMLSGLKPSADRIGRLLGEFVKSRWGIFEAESSQILRDMFLEYAKQTGRSQDVVYDEAGVAVGVTDGLKQAFVDEATQWARMTNDGIQIAAIAAKSVQAPSAAGAAMRVGGAGSVAADATASTGASASTGPSATREPSVGSAGQSIPTDAGGPAGTGGGGRGPGGSGGGGAGGGREPFPQALQDRIAGLRRRLDALRAQRGQARNADRLRAALDEMLARDDLRARDAELVVDSITDSLSGAAPVRDTPLVGVDPHDPAVRASLETSLRDLAASGDPLAEEYVSIILEGYDRMVRIDVGKSPRSTDRARIGETGVLRARFLAGLEAGTANSRAADIFREHMRRAQRGPGGQEGAVARGELVLIDRASGERATGPGPNVVGWPAERGRAWWVDHIVELQHGGADDASNYLPLSDLLNRLKSTAMTGWTNSHREALQAAKRAGEDVPAGSY